jgi:hypothetical protein
MRRESREREAVKSRCSIKYQCFERGCLALPGVYRELPHMCQRTHSNSARQGIRLPTSPALSVLLPSALLGVSARHREQAAAPVQQQ